jgi:hypothetical protein
VLLLSGNTGNIFIITSKYFKAKLNIQSGGTNGTAIKLRVVPLYFVVFDFASKVETTTRVLPWYALIASGILGYQK